MSDVTRLPSKLENGDSSSAEELLPLIYDELRKLAAARLKYEKPGQTIQATALVHDAYVRLVGSQQSRGWDLRGHFCAAAAEAMRRILIDRAREKRSQKRGGELQRQELADVAIDGGQIPNGEDNGSSGKMSLAYSAFAKLIRISASSRYSYPSRSFRC